MRAIMVLLYPKVYPNTYKSHQRCDSDSFSMLGPLWNMRRSEYITTLQLVSEPTLKWKKCCIPEAKNSNWVARKYVNSGWAKVKLEEILHSLWVNNSDLVARKCTALTRSSLVYHMFGETEQQELTSWLCRYGRPELSTATMQLDFEERIMAPKKVRNGRVPTAAECFLFSRFRKC